MRRVGQHNHDHKTDLPRQPCSDKQYSPGNGSGLQQNYRPALVTGMQMTSAERPHDASARRYAAADTSCGHFTLGKDKSSEHTQR